MRRSLLALSAALLLPLAAQAEEKFTVAVVDFARLADSPCAQNDARMALAAKVRANAELKLKEAKKGLEIAGAEFKRTGKESAMLTMRTKVAEAQQDMAAAEMMWMDAKQKFAIAAMPMVREALHDKGYHLIVARVGLVQAPPKSEETNVTNIVIRSCGG